MAPTPFYVAGRPESSDDLLTVTGASEYGLQAGMFTRDLQTAFTAAGTLDVGGVIVGDVPSYRADQMPYGGTKGSGVGREVLRWAMDDYTDTRGLPL